MKYKTFNEFLKFYKTDIDAFADRHVTDYPYSNYNSFIGHRANEDLLVSIIGSAFSWFGTPEGGIFWANIDSEWFKYCHDNKKEILSDIENFFQIYTAGDLSMIKAKLKKAEDFNEIFL